MNKKEVAEALEEIGLLLELAGENPFKTRAYGSAARAIERSAGDLKGLVETGELLKVKGIGDSIFAKIKQMVEQDKSSYLEELHAKVHRGLVEMIRIPGFGPKRARAVHEKLGINSLGELEYACRENRLVKLEGFGQKSQDKILAGIQFLKRHQGRFLISDALSDAERLLAVVQGCKETIRACVAGSLRRCKETVKDVDILAAVRESGPVMDAFTKAKGVETVAAKGDTKSSIVLSSGLASDLRTVSEKEYPYALAHFTGSAEHNIAMRARAQQKFGYKLNEYGLFKGDKLIDAKDEKEIFKKLDLAYIEPELRENAGEIEAAEKGKLPNLLRMEDIKGVLHVHTTASDGSDSLDEVAKAAEEAGYLYLGVTDHSKTAVYAGGLKEQDVLEQHRAIDNLNKKLKKLRILKGTESDILPDGSLDFPDKVLERFDFVVVSVHSSFNLSRAEMTKRIVKAMKNPYTSILGHPTGRLLLAREGYDVDLDELLKVAAGEGVAVELNADPHRLDLDWRYGKRAHDLGVKVAIDPDAHSAEAFSVMRYGVGIARKGWLEAGDVLNALETEALLRFFQKRRSSK